MALHRFWLTFAVSADRLPIGIGLGCGVTAADRDSAIALIQARVFRGKELPEIALEIEDVDVSGLDEHHVLPNMGNVFEEGIWYPQGY